MQDNSSNGAQSNFQNKNGLEIIVPKTYKIQTHWLPQAQFAGYYMAMEKGLYKEMGLNIELLDGGPDVNPLFGLVRGEIQFGTAWLTSVLITVARGAHLNLLAQVFQKSGLLLVALKSSGIKTIQDMKEKSSVHGVGFLSIQ